MSLSFAALGYGTVWLDPQIWIFGRRAFFFWPVPRPGPSTRAFRACDGSLTASVRPSDSHPIIGDTQHTAVGHRLKMTMAVMMTQRRQCMPRMASVIALLLLWISSCSCYPLIAEVPEEEDKVRRENVAWSPRTLPAL